MIDMIKRSFKTLNNIFIGTVLFLFYVFIIGFTALIYKLFKKKRNKQSSHWQDVSVTKLDSEYFRSAY